MRREVETLLKCDHPAIPKVVEFGESGENKEILLTTFLHGESLAERVAGGNKLSLADSISVFGQVFDCLDYLDKKDIFHGSVSPEMIVIGKSNRVSLMGVGATPRERHPLSVTVLNPETGKELTIKHSFETHQYFPRFLDWHGAARCLVFGLYGEDLLKVTYFDREYDHERMAEIFQSLRPELPDEIADFLAVAVTQNGTFSHPTSFYLRFVEVAQKYINPVIKEGSWWRKAARRMLPSGLWK